MNKESLIHTYTRLQTGIYAVYLAEDDTKNVLEMKRHMLILDNEATGEETRIQIIKAHGEIMRKFFESNYGKKLSYINTDELDLVGSKVVAGLENESTFVCIDKTRGDKPMYIVSLVEKGQVGKECTVEITEEVYNAFKEYTI